MGIESEMKVTPSVRGVFSRCSRELSQSGMKMTARLCELRDEESDGGFWSRYGYSRSPAHVPIVNAWAVRTSVI